MQEPQSHRHATRGLAALAVIRQTALLLVHLGLRAAHACLEGSVRGLAPGLGYNTNKLQTHQEGVNNTGIILLQEMQ